MLSTSEGWSRGVLGGFMGAARENGWAVLHYHPSADLSWLAEQWSPTVAVIGPGAPASVPALACPIVSVNVDRTPEGVASVLPDEAQVAELALRHLLDRRLEHLTTFRLDHSAFAITRERTFETLVASAQVPLAPAYRPNPGDAQATEEPETLVAWLRALPRPCGIFACSDAWGRVVARYALAAGLRIPQEVALVGADNDVVECELIEPPLSSVAVPWRTLGEEAATLVGRALAGEDISGQRVIVPPVDVVARRSSDLLAVDDALVADAVAWIGSHAVGRLRVPMVARAVASSRQRLERRFRASLGRTILGEIRRARVEAAKGMLRTTDLELKDVARQTGFTTAALLNEAFQREVGMTPGVYRRRMKEALSDYA